MEPTGIVGEGREETHHRFPPHTQARLHQPAALKRLVQLGGGSRRERGEQGRLVAQTPLAIEEPDTQHALSARHLLDQRMHVSELSVAQRVLRGELNGARDRAALVRQLLIEAPEPASLHN